MTRPFRSIGQALYGAFALVALINMVCVGFFFFMFTLIYRGEAASRESTAVLLRVEELRSALLDMESGQRGYTLTLDESYLDQYEQARRSVEDAVGFLRDSYVDDAEGSALLGRVWEQIDRWKKSYLDFALEQANLGNTVSPKFLARGSGYTGAMWSLLSELKDREVSIARDREVALDGAFRAAMGVLILGACLGSATAALMALWLGRFVRPPLKAVAISLDRIAQGDLRGTSEVLDGRDEIASLSRSEGTMRAFLKSIVGSLRGAADRGMILGRTLSSKANNMDLALREVSFSVERVSRFFTATAEALASARGSGAELDGFATKTMEMIQAQSEGLRSASASALRMVGDIDALAEDSKERGKKAHELAEAAGKGVAEVEELFEAMDAVGAAVAKVVGLANVIGEISDRTNLLSMNAAIEAARAGAAGKGFSVVADAIRTLSRESAASAQEIYATLRAATEKIQRADEVGRLAEGTLKDLSAGVAGGARSAATTESRLVEMASRTSDLRGALSALDEMSGALAKAGLSAVDRSRSLKEVLERISGDGETGVRNLSEGAASLAALREEAASLDAMGEQNANSLETLERELSRFQ